MNECKVSWIGPAGGLVPFKMPRPDIAAPQPRAMESFKPLHGAPRFYTDGAPERSWGIELGYATPTEVGNILALEQGVFGAGPWWWLSPWALHTNMLPAHVARPWLPGADTLWLGSSTRTPQLTLSDGRVIPESAGVTALTCPWVPCLPGEVYTARAHAGTAGGYLRLEFLPVAGSQFIGFGSVVGSGRLVTSAVAPEGAARMRLRLETRAASGGPVGFTALGLRAGLPDAVERPWVPGEGVPRVIITDVSRSLRIVNARRQHADLSVTFREVA